MKVLLTFAIAVLWVGLQRVGGAAAPVPVRQPAAPAAASPAPESAGIRVGTKISAALESALDARTAKPGDEVRARVTKDVKQDGLTVIRKGDHLVGHIASVDASGKANGGSRLSIDFNRLLEGQSAFTLRTLISAVTPREVPDNSLSESEPLATGPGMPPTASRSGSPANGGLGGGLASGVDSTLDSTLGGVGGNVAGTLDATTGIAGGAGARAASGTPMGDIRIGSQGEAAQQSTLASVLSTRRGNLALDSGTLLQFRVLAQGETKLQVK